jgi:hypothetical protein
LSGLGAGQIVIEVRQTFHFTNVGRIRPQPLFGVAPLPYPIVRVSHDVFDFKDFAVFEQAHPFLHPIVFRDRDAAINVVVVGFDVTGVDYQGVPLEMP